MVISVVLNGSVWPKMVQGLSRRLCFLKRLSDRQKHLIHVLLVANNYYGT